MDNNSTFRDNFTSALCNMLEDIKFVAHDNADSGTERYLSKIQEEIKYQRLLAEEHSKPSGLSQLLEMRPEKDQVILVNARTKSSRAAIHEYARQNNLWSSACYFSDWDENYIYQCKRSKCKKSTSSDEMIYNSDISFISGDYMGTDIICPHCRKSYFDAEDPEDSDLRRYTTVNSIVISQSIVYFASSTKYGRRPRYNIHDNMSEDKMREILDKVYDWKIKIDTIRNVSSKITLPKIIDKMPKNIRTDFISGSNYDSCKEWISCVGSFVDVELQRILCICGYFDHLQLLKLKEDELSLIIAIKYQYCHILKYLIDQGFKITRLCREYAAKSENQEIKGLIQ